MRAMKGDRVGGHREEEVGLGHGGRVPRKSLSEEATSDPGVNIKTGKSYDKIDLRSSIWVTRINFSPCVGD